MKKSLFRGAAVAVAVTTALPVFTSINAYAATSFDSQYQSNASQEAALLSQAQASNFSDSYTVVLRSTVLSLNAQVAALYNAEQSLAAQQSQATQIDQQSTQVELQKLEQQYQKLQNQLKQAQGDLNSWWWKHGRGEDHGHGKENYGQAHKKVNQLDQQLKKLTKQMDSLKRSGDDDSQTQASHPYSAGLSQLQKSILQLQQSAIEYTKDWIAEEQSQGTTNPSSLPAPTLTVNTQYPIYTITASGASPASTVILYNNANGQIVRSASVSNAGIATFNDVSPGQYYVVQTQNGVTSPHSNVVNVASATLPTPKLTVSPVGGFNQISLSGGTSGATAHLYNALSPQTQVTSTTVNSSGNATFTQLPAGMYYVVETDGSAESASSNQVTVQTELVTPSVSRTTINNQNAIHVDGGVSGATAHLYNNANGALVANVTLDTSGAANFQNVGNGSYYVVEQATDGTLSRPSTIVFIY